MVCQSAPPASAPEPRLTARSMLSLGTEDFLAFWMASQSVGFPSGSAPPTLAATSMFLISLANSLPRLASLAAFWCLVVAHLEWPLIARRTPVLSGGATRSCGGPNCPIAAAATCPVVDSTCAASAHRPSKFSSGALLERQHVAIRIVEPGDPATAGGRPDAAA